MGFKKKFVFLILKNIYLIFRIKIKLIECVIFILDKSTFLKKQQKLLQ